MKMPMQRTAFIQSNSINKRNLFGELIQKIFQGIGDICEILVNAATGISWKTSKKLTYTRADIEADSKLNDKIQVDDPVSDIDNDETLNADDYNALRTVNIKSTAVKGLKLTNVPIPVIVFRIIFNGTLINEVTKIPIPPEQNPKVIVSALNKVKMSLFEAPRLLKIPISLILSNTEI